MAIGLNSPLIINGQEVYPQVTPKNVKGLIDFIYPVGSIYMSINSTDPTNLFGGVWEQIEDRFLLSAGTTYTAGSTGGKAEHRHVIPFGFDENRVYMHTNGTEKIPAYGSDVHYEDLPTTDYLSFAGNYEDTSAIRIAYTTTNNNIPPYYAVYMWQRTA